MLRNLLRQTFNCHSNTKWNEMRMLWQMKWLTLLTLCVFYNQKYFSPGNGNMCTVYTGFSPTLIFNSWSRLRSKSGASCHYFPVVKWVEAGQG
jgi:hypothetical protein